MPVADGALGAVSRLEAIVVLIGDDVVSSAVMKQIDNLYPRLVVLDAYRAQSRYAFVMVRMLRALVWALENDGVLEIYKIDYQTGTGQPTLYLVSSPSVDDELLEALFDEFTPRLRRIAQGQRLD